MKYTSSFQEESIYLNKIVNKLDESIKYFEIQKQELDEELKQLYSMYTPASPEYYDLIPIKESLNQVYKKDIMDYKKAVSKPYFGKIIYLYEDDKKDTVIYIGKKGLSDSKNSTNLLVIDWRAPVSEIYYSNTLGKTSFSSPDGEAKVDLKLKTTFDIKDSQLIDLYDSEIIANDDLLVKYLSKNKDVVLNEIVATIQQDQNKIIRTKANKNIIVQGVAGSGKTTVALHRIAYLLYNYSKTLSPENIYIIASNELFLNYITSMLPDLDVHNINQGTLLNVIVESIKDYYPKFTFKHCNNSCEVSNTNLIKSFDNYFELLEQNIFNDEIKIFDFVLISSNDFASILKDKSNLDVMTKAEILDSRISYILSFNKDKIINFVLENRNNKIIKQKAKQLFSIKKEDIFEEDITDKYKVLVNKYKQYFRKKVKKIKYMDAFKQINNKCNRIVNIEGRLSINDLALILMILNKLEKNNFFKSIKHIVIDEAQDLNEMLYYCLKRVFSNSKFTIVGDVMQNIEEHGLHEWKNIIENVFDNDVEYLTLLKSYRNTIEISNFAKKIVEFHTHKTFSTQPVLRHGEEVKIYTYKNETEKLKYLYNILEELKNKNCNLNAIICKDNESIENLYSQVKGIKNIELLLPDMDQLNFKNYIVSLKNSKGLEFDGVIIWDFDLYELEGDNYDYKLLYVAATRALHQLHVFSNTYNS